MKIKPFLITLLACLLCFILLPFLEKINAPLADFLPDGFLDNEMQLNEIQEKLIIQPDTLQYIFTLILMAALPAFCEEIVFRGFLINKIKASGISNQGAIFLSAAIFAITHFQPLKFLAMFLFGVLLAIIYLRFKNIKYSMLLHFLINGIQITMGHLMATGSLPSEL